MNRVAAERAGRIAEGSAACWLILKGYRIVDRRFRSGQGEIDLVARRGRTIAFVEVKRRADHDTARASVTPAGQRRIVDAATIWLARHAPRHEGTVRYDIVTVGARLWRPRHVPDAFRPSDRAGDDGAGLF